MITRVTEAQWWSLPPDESPLSFPPTKLTPPLFPLLPSIIPRLDLPLLLLLRTEPNSINLGNSGIFCSDDGRSSAASAYSFNLTLNTGPIGYSDSAGRPKKCHFKQLALYPMIFIVRRSFLGPKNCHRSRIVTPTGVTVTNRACSDISLAFAHLVPRQEK